MTVVVTHTTPADGTFSAAGAAAWDADHALSGLGTMAEQNKTSVDIEGGTIDNTTIGATTPSTGVFTTLTATGQTSLGGAADAEALRAVTTASAINWVQVSGATNGNAPSVLATGANTSVFLDLASKGTAGGVRFKTAVSTEQMRVSHTASAVNYVQVTGAATGGSNYVGVSAQGSDSIVNIELVGKGAANARVRTVATGGWIQLVPGLEAFRATGVSSAVNFHQVQNSATGGALQYSAQGTDTNIPIAFQPKGTGAIDLAAGSSGVNISNGGTVTALTVTSAGSAYTTIPTPAITAPTTAGGVQATATATMSRATSTIVSGGTGYTLNDTITVVGGTFTTAASFTVSAVSGGVVTALAVANGGTYSVLPTGTLSTTGGTGTGLTLTIDTWSVRGLTITNAGSGYVEQPTVTFSGGGGSGAAAYATVGSGTIVKSIGSTMSFSTPSSEVLRIFDNNPSAQNYLQLESSGGGSIFRTAGASANPSFGFVNKGTGSFYFSTSNSSGTVQLNVAHTASAVNYVQVTGAATTAYAQISAQGSDTNPGILYTTKGTGEHRFSTAASITAIQFRVRHINSPANYCAVIGAPTGSAPEFQTLGTDTNIDLALTPKGTGNVRFGTYTASMAFTVQGYIEIKDSGGTVRKLAVVA